MLIVIGMDNTGKTTLVESLCKSMKLGSIKSPGPIPEPQQKEWVLQQIANTKEHALDKIYERFPIFEEVVYGNVLRGKSNFQFNDNYYSLLKKSGPIIIYTRPSNEIIFNFGSREQFPGVIEQKEKLLAAYDALTLRLLVEGWNLIIYDYVYNEDIKALTFTLNMMSDLGGLMK